MANLVRNDKQNSKEASQDGIQ